MVKKKHIYCAILKGSFVKNRPTLKGGVGDGRGDGAPHYWTSVAEDQIFLPLPSLGKISGEKFRVPLDIARIT